MAPAKCVHGCTVRKHAVVRSGLAYVAQKAPGGSYMHNTYHQAEHLMCILRTAIDNDETPDLLLWPYRTLAWTQTIARLVLPRTSWVETCCGPENVRASWFQGRRVTCGCWQKVIHFMRVHPRVNILAATLDTAIDDIFHFCVSFFLIFVLFSVLACASFGRSMPEYSTFSNSMLTQFVIMTGGIGDYGDNSTSYIIYLLLLGTVQGLFMLNFFLAIVIDNYAEVKQKMIDQITEQNVLVDLMDVILLSAKRVIHRWPSAQSVTEGLKRLPSNRVTEAQLTLLAGGGKRGESFVTYYSSYDFLLEEDEETTEAPPDKTEMLDSKIEMLMAQNKALLAHLKTAAVSV